MEKSYNGWDASPTAKDFGGLDNRTVPGSAVKLAPGVRAGDVAVVLFHVAEQLHARVEKGGVGCWGWNYRLNRNAANLSCHASGTAFDWNAPLHPNGKAGTFTKAQVAEIRRIQAEVGKVVDWGGDFPGTKDEMHFEISGTAAQVAAVARQLTSGTPAPGAAVATGAPLTPEDDMFDDTDRQLLHDLHAAMGALKGGPGTNDFRPFFVSTTVEGATASLRTEGVSGAAEPPTKFVAAVLAALPQGQGYVAVADIEAAVRRVFADAGSKTS